MYFCAPITITLDGVQLLIAEQDLVTQHPTVTVAPAGEDLDYIDATHVEPISRGNRVNSISWSCERRFATQEEAFTFVAEFDQWVPNAGALVKAGTAYPHGRCTSASATLSTKEPTRVEMTFSINYGKEA